jgi:hypothetical protein
MVVENPQEITNKTVANVLARILFNLIYFLDARLFFQRNSRASTNAA